MNVIKRFKFIISALLIGLSSVFAGTENENRMEKTVDIQELIQEYVDQKATTGVVVGFIDRGIIKTYGFGTTSLIDDEKVNEKTIYEVGSITKVFTTLGLMDMVARGIVQLDDPVELHLQGVKIPDMNGDKITLAHLATHHSGLPCMPTNFNPKNPLNPFEDYTLENLYEFLNSYELTRFPGDSFEYSNVGMGLLGHILCLKASKTYEEWLLDCVLNPLEMHDTTIFKNLEKPRTFAKGHHLGLEVNYLDFTEAIVAAGALKSNVCDLLKFLAANMGLLKSPLNPLLKECQMELYAIDSTTAIGLGWILSKSENGDIIWHNGGTAGFRSFIGFDRKKEKGVVVLSNSTEGWPEQLGLTLLQEKNDIVR